jgi:O-antigen ligase
MWQQFREYWRSSAWFSKLFALSLFLFYAFIVVDLWDWAKHGLYLATLIALIVLFRNGLKFRLTPIEWLVLAAIVAWLLHTALSAWLNDIPEQGYDHFRSRQTKWLFFVPIYLYVRQYHLPLPIFWAGVFLCILVTGIDTLHQFYDNGYSLHKRVDDGGQLALRYGAIIGTMIMISVLPILQCWREQRFRVVALLGLLTLLGFCAVIIAGTRSAWLALVVFALGSLIWLAWRRTGVRQVLLTCAIVVAGMAALYQLDHVEKRVGAIYDQAADYYSEQPEVAEQAKRTSIGVRFELWKIAWQLGGEQIWYGHGPGSFNAIINEEYQQRNWPGHLREFEYPHNQYLAAWATRGLPGVALLLLLSILPFLFFRHWANSSNEELWMIAFAGLILVLSFMIYNLTYDHFEKRAQIAFYVMTLAVLMGMLGERAGMGQSGAVMKQKQAVG